MLDENGKAAGLRRERSLGSRQFRDGSFHNTAAVGAGLKGNPLPLLGEYFFGGEERVPRARLPLEDPRPAWLRAPETGLRATWLGHSTVLLEVDGARVLTDPVFGERASPLRFAGPRRFHRPPVSVLDLPALDAVVISPDHYDHFCADTVRALAARGAPFVTSLGVGAHLAALGVPQKQIVELDWWESHAVRGLSLTAAPAQHFSGRGIARNGTLWSSWALRGDRHRVFFSGDTGPTAEFEQVGARLGPFDLVLLEVGAFHPAWGDIHLGPENALAVHRTLGGRALMPVHWGTFNLALHAWDEPVETLWEKAGDARLFTPRLGAAAEPARSERPTAWWRELGEPSARQARALQGT